MNLQAPFRVGLIATLGVGVALLIWGAATQLATIITYCGVAIFLALGVEPIIRWLERRRVPRGLAVVIVLVLLVGIVGGILWLIVPTIVSQAVGLVASTTEFVQGVDFNATREAIQSWVDSTGLVFDVQTFLDDAVKFLNDPTLWGNVTGGVLAVGLGIFNGLFGVFIVLILTIYFTASLPGIKRALYRFVPASKRVRFADLSEQISDSVGRYVVGQITLAAINAVLNFTMLTIIGAPFPSVLATISFIAALIPLVGTLIGSIINTLLVLAFTAPDAWTHPWTWLIAAIYYLVYMQVEAYVVSPNIMRRAVSVPGAVVVLAALVGGTLLGILGALIAIPVAAAILLIVKEVVVPRQNER